MTPTTSAIRGAPAKRVAKLASQLGRVWLFELALRLEALAGAPMAAESAHGADEARSSGKRYFLRGQSLCGGMMLGRA
jgi:hypothetical protein